MSCTLGADRMLKICLPGAQAIKLFCMRDWLLIVCLVAAFAGCRAADTAPVRSKTAKPWVPGLAVPTAALDTVRGMRDYRGIVHLHSPFSHDACDGHEKELTDAQCLDDLREGICRTYQDFIYLTDHPAFFEDHEFPEVLLYRDGDTLIEKNGKPAANRLKCASGHDVLLQAGFEASDVMAVGFYEHAGTDAAERAANYGRADTAAIEVLRAKGAAIYIPHTESKDFDVYSKWPIEAQEIYNIHANLDPRIRKNWLGLDEAGYFGTLLKFTTLAPDGPHPDLSFLSFFEANQVNLEKWDRILPLRKVAGIAGSDAHQNVFTNKMRDGERGDSYRRILSFFSNHILVDGALELDSPKVAIRNLRGYVAFEAFGVPQGFDFYAARGEKITEMGGDAAAGGATELRLSLPQVYGLPATFTAPIVRGIIYRIAEGRREVAASGTENLIVRAPKAGIYRAEIIIRPEHLRPFLGTLGDSLIHDYPWVYANPIFVR